MSKIVIKDYIPFKQYVLDTTSNNYTFIKSYYFNSDLSSFVPAIACSKCLNKVFIIIVVKRSIEVRCKKCNDMHYFTTQEYLNHIENDSCLGYKLKWLYIREVTTIKL